MAIEDWQYDDGVANDASRIVQRLRLIAGRAPNLLTDAASMIERMQARIAELERMEPRGVSE